jgi:serine 3-dehydrogenase
MPPGTVVITGAAGGIGRCTAKVLLDQGFSVDLIDRSAAGLERLTGDLGTGPGTVRSWPMDLTAPDADERLAALAGALERAGERVRALVHCAGVGGWNPIEDVVPAQWDAILDTNLRGAYLACRHLVPLLRAEPGSNIVLLASDSADFGSPRRAAYCASKHGLAGLAAALREELRPGGVRVCLVKMSRVDTAFNGGTAGSRPQVLQPETVADAVRFVVVQPPLVEIRELSLTSVASPYGPLAVADPVPMVGGTDR